MPDYITVTLPLHLPLRYRYKAIKKTSCLMLPREEYIAVASEFPADIFKMRKKALDLAKELYGEDKTAGLAVTQEVEAILAKKGSAIFDMLVAVVSDQEDQARSKHRV